MYGTDEVVTIYLLKESCNNSTRFYNWLLLKSKVKWTTAELQIIWNFWVQSRDPVPMQLWGSIGNWVNAYSSWRLGCKGAREDHWLQVVVTNHHIIQQGSLNLQGIITNPFTNVAITS
jgi:hypothetical protein